MAHMGPTEATYDKQAALRTAIYVLDQLAEHGEYHSALPPSNLRWQAKALRLALATSIARVGQRRRTKKARQHQAVRST